MGCAEDADATRRGEMVHLGFIKGLLQWLKERPKKKFSSLHLTISIMETLRMLF